MKKILVFVVLLLFYSPFSSWAGDDIVSENLIIKSKSKEIKYSVEIANTPENQQKGLMYRTKLAENAGMLFVFAREQNIQMWMKNTFIPLDMLFIDKQGKILYIEHSAIPKSLKIISANSDKVFAVLEINGGDSEKKNIKIGDRVIYKAFANE